MPRSKHRERALKLAGGVAAALAVAGLGGVPTGLIDIDSLLRATDFFDLNPLW